MSRRDASVVLIRATFVALVCLSVTWVTGRLPGLATMGQFGQAVEPVRRGAVGVALIGLGGGFVGLIFAKELATWLDQISGSHGELALRLGALAASLFPLVAVAAMLGAQAGPATDAGAFVDLLAGGQTGQWGVGALVFLAALFALAGPVTRALERADRVRELRRAAP